MLQNFVLLERQIFFYIMYNSKLCTTPHQVAGSANSERRQCSANGQVKRLFNIKIYLQ